MDLKEFFSTYPEIAIAFSGGADSAYLLYEASRYCKRLTALYYKSEFQPDFEVEDAKAFCYQYGIPLTIIPASCLSVPSICENMADRCYYCKTNIMSILKSEALRQEFSVLADGTNASDSSDNRPGMRALTELNVLSPLQICGITKDMVRERSHTLGLFTWNKPAYACLATRVPTGNPITADLLMRIQACENILFIMEYQDFRVRIRDGYALLQVRAADYPRAVLELHQIKAMFSKYFSDVVLDENVR